MVADAAAIAVVKAARPAFRGAHDGVAFAANAAFLAAGYSLCAVGPDALTDPPPSGDEEVGIDGWNSMDNCYAFLYVKEEKGKKKHILMKCLVIGDFLTIDVVDVEAQEKEPYHVQINFDFGSYIIFSEEMSKNYGDMYKNFTSFIETLNSSVLCKLDGKDADAEKKPDVESSSSVHCSDNGSMRTAEPSGMGSGMYKDELTQLNKHKAKLVELWRKEVSIMRHAEEDKIMAMDISTMDEASRDYFSRRKAEIIARSYGS